MSLTSEGAACSRFHADTIDQINREKRVQVPVSVLGREAPLQLNVFEVEHALMKKLPKRERETIISFNEADETADVFTYDRRWQRHIQDRLGIAPYQVTEFGGRFYELPKKAIPKPSIRKRQNLTPGERARRRDRLSKIRAQIQDSGQRIGSDKGPGVDSARSKQRARGSGDVGGAHH